MINNAEEMLEDNAINLEGREDRIEISIKLDIAKSERADLKKELNDLEQKLKQLLSNSQEIQEEDDNCCSIENLSKILKILEEKIHKFKDCKKENEEELQKIAEEIDKDFKKAEQIISKWAALEKTCSEIENNFKELINKLHQEFCRASNNSHRFTGI